MRHSKRSGAPANPKLLPARHDAPRIPIRAQVRWHPSAAVPALPTHRRLPNAAKRPVYLVVFTRSGALLRCSSLVTIPISLPPKSDEAPLAGGAHMRRRLPTAAPAYAQPAAPPNAAKRPVYLATPTRTGALCRSTSLVLTLRPLLKVTKHPAQLVAPT